MQLVKIRHTRCDEWSGQTFVLALDDWDESLINSKVYAAESAYLNEFRKVMKNEAGPPNPGWGPNYDKYPDKTVAEVKSIHEAAKKVYMAWTQRQTKTHNDFERFLADEGFISLWSDQAEIVKCEVDWGHRHGAALAYGNDDKINTVPSPAILAGNKEENPFE